VVDDEVNSAARARGAELIGRERELAELQGGLQDALAGRGRLFIVVGEAGIGKTRLASELESRAVAAGAAVRWARCWEGGGAPAFWPWTVVVRAVSRGFDDQALTAALGAGAPQVVQLAPELRLRLPGLPEPPLAPLHDSEDVRFPLFEAVTAFLRRAAARQPLVLILDDLHAADHASLLLLNFLARDLHDAALLVLGTYREIEAHSEPERARILTAVGRAGLRLPLAGWGEDEIARFVSQRAGTPPAAPLIGALQRVTEGNPFFVDEIVRLLLADGGGTLAAVPSLRIPGSIRATIRERLRPLDQVLIDVLGAAAVCGREFDLALLRESCAVDGEWLLSGLGEGEAAGVVQRSGGPLPRYRFAHALIRETLYEDLTPAQRITWHRRVGTALERLHAGNLEPVLDQLAHHFAHAAPDGGVAKAVDYDARAARRAAALLAYEEAARHYERALQVHALRAPADPAGALELRVALGDMQAAAWMLSAAAETFRQAAEQARRLALPDVLARAALGLAGLGFGLPRGVVDPEIVGLLEEALRGIGDRRDALWARVAVRLAVELHFSAEAERRDALSQEAVAVARRAGDRATLAYVINARHFAVWDSSVVDERLRLADEAVRLADAAGELDVALQARTWRLLDLAEIGDGTTFERELEIFGRLAEDRRLPKYLGFAVALRGMRALWHGRFDEAVERAQEVVALGQRVGNAAAFGSVAVQIFIARRAQGRLGEIEPLVRQWTERTPTIPAARCMLALTCIELEGLDDARRHYEQLAADDFVALQRRNVLHPLLPYLTEVAVALGDTRRAPILYRGLLPFAGRNMGLGPNALFGPASHWLGLLAAMLGQSADAVQHFEAALEESTRMQGPAWLAAIEYDYAHTLFLHGGAAEVERAAILAASAAAAAERLGMGPLLARAEALRAQIVGRGDSQATRAVAALGTGAPVERAPSEAATTRDGTGGGRLLHFPVKSSGRASARAGGPHDGLFRCEGEYWSIGAGGDLVRLRNTAGLRYLAHLLRHPNREFHALDLAVIEQAPDATPELAAAQAAEAGLVASESAAAHELLDDQARAAYRRQLDDLRDQLEEARRFNEGQRAATLEGEIDFLSRELARAVGLGGRGRPGSSRAERARLNVTRAIKSALRRIAAGNRDLGIYFETTVRTGTFCSYTPDPRFPITWTF
jgi:hypothetical protein